MKHYFAILFFVVSAFSTFSQDLESLLAANDSTPKIKYTESTFKSTRVINLQTVEQLGQNSLEFRISHRFGALNGGGYEFFGLDQAQIRLALEYGIKDWLMVGLGRSSLDKTYDSFLKMRLLRQSSGDKNVPISANFFSSLAIFTTKWQDENRENYFSSRIAYTNQLILARKINEKLSLEIAPTLVHRNLVASKDDENDIFSLGIGGRFKLSKRVSLNLEYFYRLNGNNSPEFEQAHNTFSVGFDIETGGHVFQLHLTNAYSMIEKGFAVGSYENWLDGGIHFGFNISREFVVNQKKKAKKLGVEKTKIW